jgi:hypothetical protein
MNSPEKNRESDALRQYLLGLLPEEKREAIDQRILSDSEFYEQLEVTEEDLVDEYLAGGLSDQERQQFEVHFAISEERQQLVRFGRGWREHLQTAGPPARLGPHSVLNRPSLRAGLIATVSALILVAVAGGWLINQRTNQQKSVQQVIPVTLTSGTLRGEGQPTQRLKRPPANSTLNVELPIATNDYPTYSVELSKENEVIKPFKALHARPKESHFIVVVPVDSELLDEGDYTFSLAGVSETDQTEHQGSYNLRITR